MNTLVALYQAPDYDIALAAVVALLLAVMRLIGTRRLLGSVMLGLIAFAVLLPLIHYFEPYTYRYAYPLMQTIRGYAHP